MTLTREVDLSDDQVTALRYGLGALRSAHRRLMEAVRKTRDDQALWAASVEGTWWATALDEQLEKAHGTSYTSLRDVDEDGRYVLGVRYARDRHVHQLALSTDHDRGSFFGGPGGNGYGPPYYISKGAIWRSADELPPPEKKHEKVAALRRPHYEELMQGQQLWAAISHCLGWFEQLSQDRSCALAMDQTAGGEQFPGVQRRVQDGGNVDRVDHSGRQLRW